MAKVKYLEGRTEQFGYSFAPGEAVEVDDPKIVAKFASNQFFEVEGADDPASTAGSEASADRDENGDTPEMAEMRKLFDKAFAEVTGKLKAADADLGTANAEIKTLKAGTALKAEHHGGGKFNITKGEAVLASGLTKADADAFNALSDAEKAEYVKAKA